jgi:plasmid stabilization system protein ParE
MAVPVSRHPDVREDILGIADYIGQHSIDAAIRFPLAVETTIRDLADMPGMGSLKFYPHPSLDGVRSARVRGFRNHLVLYRIEQDRSIFIMAVLHGARLIPGILVRRWR